MTPTPAPIAAADVIARHDALLATPGWLQTPPAEVASELWNGVLRNHRCNSLLWAEEDLARRTAVADADIAANKRAIDRYNQARNDATEGIDETLLLALGLVDAASAHTDAPQSRAPTAARLNSETAGSMIDRLSILALKVHAMRTQTLRTDVDDAHRSASAGKLARLLQQRDDLSSCLDALLADALAGRATFKIYRQFKMYNDPLFNPELVKERQRQAARPEAETAPGTAAGTAR